MGAAITNAILRRLLLLLLLLEKVCSVHKFFAAPAECF